MKNNAFSDPNDAYYTRTKDFLLSMVPDGSATVLDLGCGSGNFGRKLIEVGKAKELYGVEIFDQAAEQAKKHYKIVHVGDIEEMQLPYERSFDLIVCGDVLEHLKNPQCVLKDAKRWLKDDGRIVCCLPNIRHWRIAWKLIFGGDWRYEQHGIMDQTHLRFFTVRSFSRLLEESGYKIEKKALRLVKAPKQRFLNSITFGIFEEFFAFQIMFCARKM